MENYIVINGTKLELTPEQVAALTAASAEPEQRDPFERAIGKEYFFIDTDGSVSTCCDDGDIADDDTYAAGNYCQNEEMMRQRALHETLSRLLWRYSEQHGGDSEWDGASLRAAGWHYETTTAGGNWSCPSRPRQTTAPTCKKQRWAKFLTSEEAEAALEGTHDG